MSIVRSFAARAWVQADSPAGNYLETGDEVFWKIEVNNTGNVGLSLNYIDYYDGYLINLEKYVSLPTRVEAGETVSFTYKMHVFTGVHKNEVYVSGTYENTTIVDSDLAYYNGKATGLGTSQNDGFTNIPKFVVPEYSLGVFGGLLSLISAYILSQRRLRKKQLFWHLYFTNELNSKQYELEKNLPKKRC